MQLELRAWVFNAFRQEPMGNGLLRPYSVYYYISSGYKSFAWCACGIPWPVVSMCTPVESRAPCVRARLIKRKKAILDIICSCTLSGWYVLQIRAGVAPAFLEMINIRISTLSSQSFFGFGQSAEVEIELANSENRKQVDVKNEDGKKEKLFLYYDGETVAGKVRPLTNT